MVELPADFLAWHTEHGDAANHDWLAALPELVDRLCQRWSLHPTGEPPLHGAEALVVPVSGGAMLKVAMPGPAVAREIAGLRAWAGRGTVALLDASPEHHALLLERLDAARTLQDLPAYDAAGIAGSLIARLAIDPPSAELPRLAEIAESIGDALPARNRALGSPVPIRAVEAAVSLASELGRSAAGRLVHADLHQGNVLAGSREPWLAIDARPVIGDPEYSAPELMWCGVDGVAGDDGVRRLLAAIVDGGALDADRARGWVIARCVDYWLWGLDHGLTEDPRRCARICIVLCGSTPG